MLRKIHKFIKGNLDYWLDRLVEQINLILMDVYQLPLPGWEKHAHRVARIIGDAALLIQNYPRLPVYKLENDRWSIIFVGNESGVQRLQRLFQRTGTDEDDIAEAPPLPEPIARVALWNLSGQTQQWLDAGADLVVYETSRLHKAKHPTLMAFTVAVWVNQMLSLPEDVNQLLAGKKQARTRKYINAAARDGFDYRFSQDEADFELFHYKMYRPFIQDRHGHIALIASYQDQKKYWFSRGGLLFVTEHGQPVAGLLCYIRNGVCYQIESGVLEVDTDSGILKQARIRLLNWFTILWADSQQAKIIQMGGSHGWSSDGPFTTKRRWGAKVVYRRKLYKPWTFVAQSLSSEQQAFLNKIGFISEIGDKFYHVTLVEADEMVDTASLVATAEKMGLDGAVVVKKGEIETYDI